MELLPVLKDFDFGFAENGLTAYRMGQQLESQSFIKYLGEANYKKLVNFILIKLAEIEDIPVKRYVQSTTLGRLYLYWPSAW